MRLPYDQPAVNGRGPICLGPLYSSKLAWRKIPHLQLKEIHLQAGSIFQPAMLVY